MTYCSTYVGELNDDSFSWDGGDWSGNIPKRLGQTFPQPLEHYNAQFKKWGVEAGVTWKQTDWGGWIAKVDRADIMALELRITLLLRCFARPATPRY
jgi:hypothetical protein